MTSQELIKALGLRHLRSRDVERVELALNADDAEVMLTLVDALVGKAMEPARATQKNRRRR